MPICTVAALLLMLQELQLPPKLAVQGRVVDVLDEPVPAADVWITGLAAPDRELARGRTDASGVFRLLAPRDGYLLVHATVPGSTHGMCVYRYADDPAGMDYTVRLFDAGSIRGTVVDARGDPVAGARVFAGSTAEAPTTTGLDGQFEIERVALGATQLTVVHETGTGLADVWLRDRSDVRIALADAGPPIRMRVRGLSEAAMTACAISYEVPDLVEEVARHGGVIWSRRRLPPCQLLRPHAGGDTFVLLGLGRHDVDLTAQCSGFTITPDRFRVAAADSCRDVELQAVPATTPTAWLLLRGKLCDERGQALGGEQVVGCALASDQTGTATTKANGAFELCLPCREGDGIAFVLADSHWLLASGDRSHSLPCDLGRHQDTMRIGRDYQLRATRAASIRGRLRLPDGKPAAGVAVHLLHPVETVETPGWPIASARTDADGRFTFPAVHGCGCDLQLCIHEETGYLAETFVADGEQIDLDVLTMKPAATLTGCVRDAAGRAVAGAVISLRRLDAETLSTASAAGEHALTNRDGRYRVRGLEAGEYELTTANHAPGAKPLMRRFRVRPAQQLAIDLALLQ